MLKSYEQDYIRGKDSKNIFTTRIGRKYSVKTVEDGNVEVQTRRFGQKFYEDLKERAKEFRFEPKIGEETIKIFPSTDPNAKPHASKNNYFLKWTF